MKLVVIYGAPATGKLTVGKHLARLTGYKLHHNHMAIDLALALFAFDDPYFLQLCQRINLATFEFAAIAGLPGLIFTFTYGGLGDDPFIQNVIQVYQRNIYFVHLHCDIEELKLRVAGQDREQYRKVRDPDILIHALAAIDYDKDIEYPAHLSIDTTNLPPDDAAHTIIEFINM
ncbi:MAG: AAA family ATPase [Chloroflexota bacterium]|nr:AAA family ATPase [Chloroflexota bacterium]